MATQILTEWRKTRKAIPTLSAEMEAIKTHENLTPRDIGIFIEIERAYQELEDAIIDQIIDDLQRGKA